MDTIDLLNQRLARAEEMIADLYGRVASLDSSRTSAKEAKTLATEATAPLTSALEATVVTPVGEKKADAAK